MRASPGTACALCDITGDLRERKEEVIETQERA